MSEVMQVSSVSRHYGSGFSLVKALDKVSISVKAGEFTALTGPSGSGKTTLLFILAGLDYPTSGQVLFQGERIDHMSQNKLASMRRNHIGLIFQSHNLIPVLTVEENIEYLMQLKGVKTQERKDRITKVLKQMDLLDQRMRKPSELSGGQQQKVAIARALVVNPEIILADEPTSHLDSEKAHELIDLMENLNKQQQTTFLFSTHDPSVMKRAHRLIHLQDGQISSEYVH